MTDGQHAGSERTMQTFSRSGFPRSAARFTLRSGFTLAGDQPAAVSALEQAVSEGARRVTLRGATGTGKTFTVANLICRLQRPTLLVAPNRTLAAQLAGELRGFLPDNAVELFISYYDFYQPEAYLPSSDTFIDKEATINREIDRLRHRATVAALTRRDVVIVASVSCIYGLGDPARYAEHLLPVEAGSTLERDGLLGQLVGMGFLRNDIAPEPGTFKVRGDAVDVTASDGSSVRVEFDLDQVASVRTYDPVTGDLGPPVGRTVIPPASHYVADKVTVAAAADRIEAELEGQLEVLRGSDRELEARRLETRTRHDLDQLRQLGFCPGVENYSAHLDGRQPGVRPYTLLDFFDDDWLCVVDESHVTLPQLRAMHAGDRSRKTTLVEHGFRLPSALDNRPLMFDEFDAAAGQMVMMSATPGPEELRISEKVVEQLVRPTGVLDPEVEVRPSEGQLDDLVVTAGRHVASGGRVLVTALTKKLAEMVADVLSERGLKARFLHSDLDTFEREDLLSDLRAGRFDVLVGVNLLREGLDLPEVSLVAVMDADREGFLRSATALIQTIGRAARNTAGQVVMYAEHVTPAMRAAMDETARRRQVQEAHNLAEGIVPRSTSAGRTASVLPARRPAPGRRKAGRTSADRAVTSGASSGLQSSRTGTPDVPADVPAEGMSEVELEVAMLAAAAELDFERAAMLRDALAAVRETGRPQKDLPSEVDLAGGGLV